MPKSCGLVALLHDCIPFDNGRGIVLDSGLQSSGRMMVLMHYNNLLTEHDARQSTK